MAINAATMKAVLVAHTKAGRIGTLAWVSCKAIIWQGMHLSKAIPVSSAELAMANGKARPMQSNSLVWNKLEIRTL
jgi:hypothetical protein